MKEIWRTCKPFENYQVSNMGRVRSVDRIVKSVMPNGKTRITKIRGKTKKVSINKRGYAYVCLNESADSRTLKVHQLVANAFLSEDWFPGAVINHLNGKRADNRIENLEWCTQMQNVCHARDTGLMVGVKGSRVGTSKLTEDQVLEIRRLKSEGYTHSEIAKIFGITRTNVGNIHTRTSWAHL